MDDGGGPVVTHRRLLFTIAYEILNSAADAEDAVFVLREVLGVPYGEMAEAVDKSPAAVRQIAHRAKGHVAARRHRVSVARDEHVKLSRLEEEVELGR